MMCQFIHSLLLVKSYVPKESDARTSLERLNSVADSVQDLSPTINKNNEWEWKVSRNSKQLKCSFYGSLNFFLYCSWRMWMPS